MASINKVIIVGNLGRDPEMRTFPSGDQVANVTIATTDKWKDKQTGEMREATEWHRVVFNGRLAEIVGQYLRKGSQVYVEGSLRTRKWTDQSGVESTAPKSAPTRCRCSVAAKAWAAKVAASKVAMTTAAYGDQGGGGYEPQAPRRAALRNAHGSPVQRPRLPQPQAPCAASGFDDMDDDIPF